MRRTLLLTLPLLFAIACQSAPPEMTEADRQAIAEEIKQRSAALFRGMEEPVDVAALMAFYLEDADSYFVGEPAVAVFNINPFGGVEDFRGMMERLAASRRGTSVEVTDDRVAVLSPDYAIQVLAANYSITNLEGETRAGWRMTHTHVWVKQNGEWKLLHFHESFRAPTE